MQKHNIRAFLGLNYKKTNIQKVRIVDSIYGEIIQYTESFEQAKASARKLSKGDPDSLRTQVIYEVVLSLRKTFDMEEIYSGDVVMKLVGNDVDSFIKGSNLDPEDKDDIMEGKKELEGNVIFQGLSNGSPRRAKQKLIQNGFDSLRIPSGIKYSNYIVYDDSLVRIVKIHPIKY